MKNKKIVSLALAGTLALSLVAPAFAASNNSTVITGAYQDIQIDVTVPAAATAVVNPYGLPIEFTESDDTTTHEITGRQITTAPLYIANNTALDLDVSVTVTGKTTGSLKFSATTNVDSTTPANNAFVYLQGSPIELTAQEANITSKADDAESLSDLVLNKVVAWDAAEYSEDTDVVVGTTKVTKDQFVTLKGAAVTAATADDAAFATYKTGSLAMIRLAGDLSPVLKTPWKESKAESSAGAGDAVVGDGFEVTVAYTFAPAAGE